MSADHRRYLQPETVSSLKGLELKARMVVEGFMAGLHKSPYHGFSVEFAEHRQYMPGDPIRNVDWKVFGKTDRYYIKQYEEETNLKAYLLVDSSRSMAYQSEDRISKFDYAGMLAGALGYLMLRQRDAVGLVTFSEAIHRYIPPRSKSSHLHILLNELAQTAPADATRIGPALHEMAERIKRRGLVVVMSDLLDDPAEIISGLKHFRYNQHEVLIFHILDPRETDLDFAGEAIFEDMETGERITTTPSQIKKDFARQVDAFSEEISYACRQANIDYHRIDTRTTFDQAMYAWLAKRARLF